MVILQIVILLVLIGFNGVLSMSELAIVSARTARLQQRADQGNRGALAAIALADNPSRFLSSVQIGITLIGIVTGMLGGATLAGPLASLLGHLPFVGDSSDTISVVIVVATVTYLALVIGELVPKRVALQHAESVACAVAPAMTRLARLASPVVSFLAWSNDAIIRLLGITPSTEPSVSEEEIELLLAQGAESGVFHASEHAMVAGVFDIGDRTASELMTPRHLVDFLDLARSEAENRAIMAERRHGLYPVCEGSTDNVVGMVATRDLWARQITGQSTSLRDAIVPALFVPEIAPVRLVLDQMRHEGTSMAVVVDEYGGIEGVLTLNDVLSEVVGEIDDSSRTNVKGATQREDGSWLFDGIFPIHDVEELLGISDIPGEAENRFETVGGFVMDTLGRIPDTGDTVDWDRFRWEVVDMDGNRVDKVLVSPRPESEPID